MPFLPNLLAGLAERLAENGSRFGAMPLKDIAVVLSFLSATGHENDAEMIAATLGSVLLPVEQARAVSLATTGSSDLILDLQPVQLLGVDPELAMLVARAEPRLAAVAATLLFALYHRAGRAGNVERVKQLRTWIDGLSPSEGNSELITILQAETKVVLITQIEPPKHGQILFSISIDLVGSTDAKTRVMKLAAGNSRRIDAFNSSIYNAFCKIEEDFYRHAAGNYGSGSPVELGRFFAVKGIGDEIWLLCESSPDLIAEQGARLIDAALEIASKQVHLIATENEEENPFHFDRDFDYGNVEPILSPIKVFIDVVEHATDLGKMRDDRLIVAVPRIMTENTGEAPSSSELARVLSRLTFGTSEATRWARFQVYRTDYIGHEIDRFFRATKAALPGTVAIGSSMAQHLGLVFSEPVSDIFAVYNKAGQRLRGGTPDDPIHAICRTFPAEELKGIGYPYDVYQLFAPRMLNAKYSEMRALLNNKMPAADYSPTQKILTLQQVQATAALYYPKQDNDDA
jgi:hypothetical protein